MTEAIVVRRVTPVEAYGHPSTDPESEELGVLLLDRCPICFHRHIFAVWDEMPNPVEVECELNGQSYHGQVAAGVAEVAALAGDVCCPDGIEHHSVAHGEVHLLLIEPAGTPNTGDPKTAAPRQFD